MRYNWKISQYLDDSTHSNLLRQHVDFLISRLLHLEHLVLLDHLLLEAVDLCCQLL